MTCYPSTPLQSALWALLLLPVLLSVAVIGSAILAIWLVSEIIVQILLSLCSAVSNRPRRSPGKTRRFPSITNAGAPEKSSAGTSKWRR